MHQRGFSRDHVGCQTEDELGEQFELLLEPLRIGDLPGNNFISLSTFLFQECEEPTNCFTIESRVSDFT